MTKIRASVLATVANNQMSLSLSLSLEGGGGGGEEGAGSFTYSLGAAGSATAPRIISITEGPE